MEDDAGSDAPDAVYMNCDLPSTLAATRKFRDSLTGRKQVVFAREHAASC